MPESDTSSVDWPDGFDRTPPDEREPYPGNFRVTRSRAFRNILEELGRWDGVTDVQLSFGAQATAFPTRCLGRPGGCCGYCASSRSHWP